MVAGEQLMIRVLTFSLVASGLATFALSAVAQDTEWSSEDPRPVGEEPTSRAVGAGSVSVTRNGQELGWLATPRPVDERSLDRPLTELERLSLSASGVAPAGDFYDARSDNPLEPVAVLLRGLDKITAQYTDLEIDINDTQRYGTLEITPRTCDTRPPEEFPETSAFLEIVPTADDLIVTGGTRRALEASQTDPSPAESGALPATEASTDEEEVNSSLFTGWMFASSPALNALEHPVYDVWVIGCKMVEPSI